MLIVNTWEISKGRSRVRTENMHTSTTKIKYGHDDSFCLTRGARTLLLLVRQDFDLES